MTSGEHFYRRQQVAPGKSEITDIIEPVGIYLRQLIASGKETRRSSGAYVSSPPEGVFLDGSLHSMRTSLSLCSMTSKPPSSIRGAIRADRIEASGRPTLVVWEWSGA